MGSFTLLSISMARKKYKIIIKVIKGIIAEVASKVLILSLVCAIKGMLLWRMVSSMKKLNNMKYAIFIFPDFSLGITEDRTINIIRIPPINNKKNKIGNHFAPVFILIINISIALYITNITLSLIGFLTNPVAMVTRAVPMIILNIVIFLSLKKISILDIEDLEKIDFVFFLYFLFLIFLLLEFS